MYPPHFECLGDSLMSEEKRQLELNKLILELLDGSISKEKFEQLDKLIRDDAEVAAHYTELVTINAALVKPGVTSPQGNTSKDPFESDIDQMLWKALSEEEKSAETIKTKQNKKDHSIADNSYIREVNKKIKQSRRTSRFSLGIAIASTAALLMLSLYVLIS